MHTITLSWDASPSTQVIGYRLHYGQQRGYYTNHIDIGNRTTTDVANLIDGTTYYFAVTAYDDTGGESAPSEEIHYMPSPALLLNMSARANVQPGDNALIAGFIVGGYGEKKIIVRAAGPSLANYGVHGALDDPILWVFADSQLLATNDDWRSGNPDELRTLGLAPLDDNEAAVVLTLKPGSYSAVVRGKNETSGVSVVEVYDAGPADVN